MCYMQGALQPRSDTSKPASAKYCFTAAASLPGTANLAAPSCCFCTACAAASRASALAANTVASWRAEGRVGSWSATGASLRGGRVGALPDTTCGKARKAFSIIQLQAGKQKAGWAQGLQWAPQHVVAVGALPDTTCIDAHTAFTVDIFAS